MYGHGLIIPKIETKKQGAKHVLGAAGVPGAVIKPNGCWKDVPVQAEAQNRNGVETNACTIYNALTPIERLIRHVTGVSVNFADRLVANIAKYKGILDPRVGADPHKSAELIRTISGLLPEERCPWTPDIKSREDYYGIPYKDLLKLMADGQEWYKEWELKHAWVFLAGTPQEKRKRIQDALTKGTVSASVYAWVQKDGVFYKPDGVTDNHWTEITCAKDLEPYDIFDSYDLFEKKLDPLYDFAIAKVYYLLPALFLKNLTFGTTSPEVARLQRTLVSLGYSIPHAVSSYFGPETRSALWQFQVSQGIQDDGSNFGPQTRLALNRAVRPNLAGWDSLVILIRTYAGL